MAPVLYVVALLLEPLPLARCQEGPTGTSVLPWTGRWSGCDGQWLVTGRMEESLGQIPWKWEVILEPLLPPSHSACWAGLGQVCAWGDASVPGACPEPLILQQTSQGEGVPILHGRDHFRRRPGPAACEGIASRLCTAGVGRTERRGLGVRHSPRVR